MPKLPASVSKGVTAIAPARGATPSDVARVRTLFHAVGQAMELSEDLFDAFTAVAGSGPAYVFLLAEAMERAAIELGLDPGLAPMIVRDTIAGASELLSRSSMSPRDLRDSVTSAGGTTAAALGVLDGEGVLEATVRAIAAARDRSRELGKASTTAPSR
jgi:pyrroline-5-carboxylate reductase